ncbi:MAG: alpha,alpha-trehalase TreF [Lysobacterales bacterium]|jgi:alpha,alpha-trehalase
MSLPSTPDQDYAELFVAVQAARVFADSKTFVDAVPVEDPATILAAYRAQSGRPGFDLAQFVEAHFDLPSPSPRLSEAPQAEPLRQRIESLWDLLRRPADAGQPGSSLIPLPHPYIVPGGRFREIYYWDSYFTMLGLAVSGRTELIQHMVDNFAWLIDRIGFVPNGNRSYYCSRSQPPLFAMMLDLLAAALDEPEVPARYLNQLEREYRFWMSGSDERAASGSATRRAVAVEGGFLNRYWDESDRPRQESYAEDLQLARESGVEESHLYRNVRAACESGWDFSSRWLADGHSLATIRTTDVLPVDLNAIMFHLESSLAKACNRAGRQDDAARYASRAEFRKRLLRDRFFDDSSGFFVDLLAPDLRPTGVLSLAGAYPLFLGIATRQQAESVCRRLSREFLRPGGWATTRARSGQQWDAPNGWAPLQWIVYRGLQRYGFEDEAVRGARRWVRNNLAVYERTGRLLEKYNVEEIGAFAGGGEYEVQHGFGWTNGVLLSLMDRLGPDPRDTANVATPALP